MKFLELKNSLESGDNHAVFLIEGEDAFFKRKALNVIKDFYVSEPVLDYAEFDSSFDVQEIFSSFESFPFVSKKRLTVAREINIDKTVLNSNRLKEILTNPPQNGVLVIINEKPLEALKKYDSVEVVDCSKVDKGIIVKWIKAECGKFNVSTEGETAGLIAEYCLLNMTRIEQETYKLISFVGDGGNVTAEDVKANVVKETEYKIYEMTDCIAKRNFDGALQIVKEMLSHGETFQRLIITLYNYFRKLLHVAISDKSSAELAKDLGVQEYYVTTMKQKAKTFKIKNVKNTVDALSDADYKIKNGSINAEEQFWLILFDTMTK